MEEKTVFRRINGRIVPIKVKQKPRKIMSKEKQSSLLNIGGLISSGVAITAGGAALSGFLIGKLSSRFVSGPLQAARDFTRSGKVAQTLFDGGAANLSRAVKKLQESQTNARRIESFGKKVRFGTEILGGSLVGVGLDKLLDRNEVSRDNDILRVGAATLGAGLTVVSARAIRAGLKKGFSKSTVFKTDGKQLKFKLD